MLGLGTGHCVNARQIEGGPLLESPASVRRVPRVERRLYVCIDRNKVESKAMLDSHACSEVVKVLRINAASSPSLTIPSAYVTTC